MNRAKTGNFFNHSYSYPKEGHKGKIQMKARMGIFLLSILQKIKINKANGIFRR
ncbi:MAG: hypothetical protein Q8O84_04405 [Nanoarchaeota archaeon]|nr:hypothetical protein [Nanoarchaeota archaeon]